jgi:hypothetical protein
MAFTRAIEDWFIFTVMALSRRDAIRLTEVNFSQEDYNSITYAWRYFVGKIHEDDELISEELFRALSGQQ